MKEMVRGGRVKDSEQRKSDNDGSGKKLGTIIMWKRRCRAMSTVVIEIQDEKMQRRRQRHRKMVW